MLEAGSQYMQQLHPQATDEDARLLFIERQYGKELTDKLLGSSPPTGEHLRRSRYSLRALWLASQFALRHAAGDTADRCCR